MKYILILCSFFILLSCNNNKPDSGNIADLVFTNGKIYTADSSNLWVEAVAVKDARIIAVGSTVDINNMIDEKTEVVDLEEKFVMPGVFDLHAHPFITPWYGNMNLQLTGADSKEKILEAVRKYANENPEREWIIGGQWLLGIFENDSPRKEWLDEVVSDRPVALLDQTGHAMWLNSKAIELSGITKNTETNQLIVISKDPKTGEPTGTINEQAMQMVEKVIPQASAEEYGMAINEIFEMFLSYGITSQQTAEGHRVPMEAISLLESKGKLNERVFVSWDWKTTLNLAYTLDDIENQIKNRAEFESDLIYPNYVKIFADGSPFTATSLLVEPYESAFTGGDNVYGGANMSEDEFTEAFKMFDDWGVGVHIHAMGDGTIRRVISAFEGMKALNGNSGVPHKIAHNTMLLNEDIPRIAAMEGVNIDFSPPLWYPHAGATPGLLASVGEERTNKTYPIKSALKSGLSVGQGSDWLTANPIPDPFISIQAMITRSNPFDESMPGQLNPDEAITLEEAIYINTLGGAEVLGVEDILGSISVGKFADMIILDQNLFEIDVMNIFGTQVMQTIVGGKLVYDRELHGSEDIDPSRMLDRMQHE